MRIRVYQQVARVGRPGNPTQNQCAMDRGIDAHEVRQVVVDEGDRLASTDSLNDLHDMRFNVEQSSDPNVIDRWLIANAHLLRHMPPARRIALREVLRRRKLLPNDIAEFRASM